MRTAEGEKEKTIVKTKLDPENVLDTVGLAASIIHEVLERVETNALTGPLATEIGVAAAEVGFVAEGGEEAFKTEHWLGRLAGGVGRYLRLRRRYRSEPETLQRCGS